MARFKMLGACPIEVNGREIKPGDPDFDADIPAEKLAFFTQIGALAVIAPDKPKAAPVARPSEK